MYEEKKNMKTLSLDECAEDAELLKALANPTRLSIVNHLLVNKCNVIAIETSLGVKQSNVSRHLFVLKSAGIVEGKREGNRIVQTEINEKNIQWVFSEITATSFRWQRMVKCPDDTWETEAELFAVRR